MRIYTEVNFQWNDKKGKLVEVSSDSFDYSGEMALCGWGWGGGDWETWKTRWYDEEGNVYKLKVRIREGGSVVRDRRISKSTDGGATWEDDWKKAEANVGKEDAHAWFKNEVKLFGAGKGVYGTKGQDDRSQLAAHWEETYHVDLPDSTQLAKEQLTKYSDYVKSDDWTYSEDDGEWTYTGTEDIEDGADKELSDALAKATAQLALEGYIKEWKELVEPGGFDIAEQAAKEHIQGLKTKEEAVKTAYEDIFGEEGTILDVEEVWETAVEKGEEKYRTDVETYETTREEGLEGALTGREGELESLREEARGKVRAAEAKIGAAGFASSGVGRTARDVLAEEIGREARGIGESFTEEKESAREGYLKSIDPLEKEFGEEGTAYEDYVRTRDLSAKTALSDWKTKSQEYETAKTLYEEETVPSLTAPSSVYMTELERLGGLMESTILDIREGIGDEDPIDVEWNPFQTEYLSGLMGDYGYDSDTFGLDPDTFLFTNLPGGMSTDFYDPYEADPEMRLYDNGIKAVNYSMLNKKE